LDVLPELIQIVINAAMQAERSEYLDAGLYRHNEERRDYANGFKPKTLEKGLRSERALTLALAEMYVQGVSTRKVKAITEQLCGVSISSSAVNQAASQANTRFSSWMLITSRSGKMNRYAT
jgi:transposase-like protein